MFYGGGNLDKNKALIRVKSFMELVNDYCPGDFGIGEMKHFSCHIDKECAMCWVEEVWKYNKENEE